MTCRHCRLCVRSRGERSCFLCVLRCVLSIFCVAFLPGASDSGERALSADIDYLVNIFNNSTGEGGEQYLGRWLRIGGYVHESGRDDQGRPYLVLFKFSARTTHTRCYFPPERAEEVESAQYPALVKVVGLCRGLDTELDAVVFTDCRIADDGDDS